LSSTTSREDLEKALQNGQENLAVVRTLLLKISETLVTGCTINDSSLDTYRINISTARSNTSASIQDIASLNQAIAGQKIVAQRVGHELDLKLSGSAPEQIEAQMAVLEQANAKVAIIELQLRDSVIRSPMDGIVTKQDVRVGEAVTANTIVASVISETNFEIIANVSEADIAKLNLTNIAKVTLDAYGTEVFFEAVVSKINPAEKIIEGVPTYEITLQFINGDQKIRSGMTANIKIETARRENVVAIPQRAVITRNGGKTARLLTPEGIKEVNVTTGLRGSLGDIEIISGINEGDRVILFLSN